MDVIFFLAFLILIGPLAVLFGADTRRTGAWTAPAARDHSDAWPRRPQLRWPRFPRWVTDPRSGWGDEEVGATAGSDDHAQAA